jgi:hypothetical protein
MIHFICDVCKSPLDPDRDLRYVVRMEIYAAMSDGPAEIDSDRDHLLEIHDILERMDDLEASDERLADDAYQQLRFDLCSDCRKKFLRDPLGRRLAGQLDFSKN